MGKAVTQSLEIGFLSMPLKWRIREQRIGQAARPEALSPYSGKDAPSQSYFFKSTERASLQGRRKEGRLDHFELLASGSTITNDDCVGPCLLAADCAPHNAAT